MLEKLVPTWELLLILSACQFLSTSSDIRLILVLSNPKSHSVTVSLTSDEG
jgi:hypothetical protein